MNISAINANPTLGRPQVPRKNNVAFTGTQETVEAGAKETKKAAPAIFGTIKNAALKVFGAVKKFFTEMVPGFFRGIAAHFKPSKEQVKAGGEALAEAAAQGAETAAKTVEAAPKKKLGRTILDGLGSAGKHIKKTAGTAKDAVVKFFQNNKGAKGVGLAATVFTALVAGGFAIKEIHDIATKSNPER